MPSCPSSKKSSRRWHKQLQQQKLAKYQEDLRTKAKVE
jgi:hypothetical protein